jgi:hypothetical protein
VFALCIKRVLLRTEYLPVKNTDKGNTGKPSHMNEAEEDAFLSQAVDEAKATYNRQHVDQGNASQLSHNNEVVVEDWYSDDELLT